MCGIFGQINKTKQGKFNFPAFTTLGIANDSRGGDSCGIFIDGKTEYGIDNTKLFANFVKTSKLLKETKRCHIALGHCRKASIGNVDLQRAQPVVIYNDNKQVEFVVIHNGTIYNYQELANKYIPQININGMSDSQVMAQIFYHTGYNVLNEYRGGAVFVIVDYRHQDPQIYLFKGQSKMYWTSPKATEERPFYFTVCNDTFYFSSIYSWLLPFTDSIIYTVESNVLTSVRDGDVEVCQTIDRSNCIQANYINDTNYAYSSYYPNNYINYNYKSSYCNNTDTKINRKLKVNAYGLYQFDNNEYVHGSYYVQSDGVVGYHHKALYLSFWHGVLLKNKLCFDFLNQFSNKSKLNPQTLGYVIPNTIDILSFHPTCDYRNSDFYIYQRDEDNIEYPYQGELQYIGEMCTYIIEDGIITDCNPTTSSELLLKQYNENLKFKLDVNNLNNIIINECKETTNDND